MKKNVGKVDKTLRFIIAAVLVAVGLFADIGSTLKILAFVFATAAILTGFSGI